MASDVGLGLPMEHAVRTCLLSVEMGRRLGMSDAELHDLYYLTLLRMLGCTVGAGDYAEYFGDEVAFGRDTQHLDYGDQAGFGQWVMESFAVDQPPDRRRRMLDKLFTYTPDMRRSALAGHCEVAQMLAARLGFTGGVVEGLRFVFERWDGSGVPEGVGGEALPAAVRVMTLCNEIEVHHRLGGMDAAVAMAGKRAGTAFDPAVVAVFQADPAGVLAVIGKPSVWSDLLAAEPGAARMADHQALIDAGGVMADFADLKSTYLAGHSTRVAELADAAAERLKIDPAGRLTLRFAALAHDLGRVAVSTTIWDKPGPLNDTEWEQVRLHPYYTERMLAKTPALAGAARLAGMHHERQDGSGYHRGTRTAGEPVAAGVLAAADAYAAMRGDRAHRPALDPDQAGDQLRTMASAGQLDAAAVSAVLAAAGDTGPAVRRRWPAGLTAREVDVLCRVGRGGSIQDAATDLHLAPKTVDFHLQNIYAKTGVSTRAAATLFAIQNNLLRPSP